MKLPRPRQVKCRTKANTATCESKAEKQKTKIEHIKKSSQKKKKNEHK